MLAYAKKKGMTHVIIGTFTGIVNPPAEGQQKLRSVTVLANVRLMDVGKGTVVWAKTYRQAKADFDSRLAFNGAVLKIAESAGKDATAALQQTNWYSHREVPQ